MSQNLRIVTLYKTSKGVFWNKSDAEKLKNREAENDRGCYVQHEPVRTIFALECDDGRLIFELNSIVPK